MFRININLYYCYYYYYLYTVFLIKLLKLSTIIENKYFINSKLSISMLIPLIFLQKNYKIVILHIIH
jgi:hypothetical protein